jgi:hypothetical protein
VAATAIAGVELLSRKLFLTPIFVSLFEHGHPPSVSRDQLLNEYDVYAHRPECDDTAADERFIASVPEGYVCPHSGAIFTSDGEFIVESLSGPWSDAEFTTIPFVSSLFHNGPRFTSHLLRGDIPSVEHVDDSVELFCPLVPRYQNYYHWTIETLPQLRPLDAFRAETGRQPTLLVPPDPPSWMLESLQLLGGGKYPVRHAEAPVYRGKSTLVPSFTSTVTEAEHEWFKRQTAALRGKDATDGDTPRRIYVSRAGAHERRVHNDSVVLDALSSYGFESYRLEELPIVEQVQLFADADVVVGPHGAGLSNIVYSEDVAVVELLGAQRKRNFARISEAAGFEYHGLQFRQDGPDIDVDVPRLVEAVEQVID